MALCVSSVSRPSSRKATPKRVSRETNVSVQHFDLSVARQRKRKAPFLIKVTTAAALYRPLAVELFSVAESCVVELAVAFSREADGRVLIVGY